MRTIIAGSRTARWDDVLAGIQACPWSSEISSVLSGGAFGADLRGEDWARARGVPIERHPANWKKHGRAAGPVRNAEMVAKADALIAIWDGESRGTADVIAKARAAGLKVFVWCMTTASCHAHGAELRRRAKLTTARVGRGGR